jgi:hypothetical protein
MPKIILLVGTLAVLASASATTLAFRTTTTVLAQPAAADPLAEHLSEMREQMELP